MEKQDGEKECLKGRHATGLWAMEMLKQKVEQQIDSGWLLPASKKSGRQLKRCPVQQIVAAAWS